MHLSCYIILAAFQIGSSFAGETVKVSPDSFSYSAGKDKASVKAESCSSNGMMAVSGTGSIGGVKIQYNCLNTGTFDNSGFAIICGTRGGNSKDVVCQAFYKKSVSSLVSCSDIVKGECGGTKKNCAYSCKSSGLCDSFGGIQWFQGGNYLGKDLLQTAKSAKINITPKRLSVGKASEKDWAQMSGYDLCWYAASIQKCVDSGTVVDNKSLNSCVGTKFANFLSYGWITKTDSKSIQKTVSNGDVYSHQYLKKLRIQQKKQAKAAAKAAKAAARAKAKAKAQKQAAKAQQTAEQKAQKLAAKSAQKEADKQARKDALKVARHNKTAVEEIGTTNMTIVNSTGTTINGKIVSNNTSTSTANNTTKTWTAKPGNSTALGGGRLLRVAKILGLDL